jgi:hypothetical protein
MEYVVLAELGNLTARILLCLERLSTVKIRTGSLFCNASARIGPTGAALATDHPPISSALHSAARSFTGCTQESIEYGLREPPARVQSRIEFSARM